MQYIFTKSDIDTLSIPTSRYNIYLSNHIRIQYVYLDIDTIYIYQVRYRYTVYIDIDTIYISQSDIHILSIYTSRYNMHLSSQIQIRHIFIRSDIDTLSISRHRHNTYQVSFLKITGLYCKERKNITSLSKEFGVCVPNTSRSTYLF